MISYWSHSRISVPPIICVLILPLHPISLSLGDLCCICSTYSAVLFIIGGGWKSKCQLFG